MFDDCESRDEALVAVEAAKVGARLGGAGAGRRDSAHRSAMALARFFTSTGGAGQTAGARGGGAARGDG